MGPVPSHSTVTNDVHTGTGIVTSDGLFMSSTNGKIPTNADNALSRNPETGDMNLNLTRLELT